MRIKRTYLSSTMLLLAVSFVAWNTYFYDYALASCVNSCPSWICKHGYAGDYWTVYGCCDRDDEFCPQRWQCTGDWWREYNFCHMEMVTEGSDTFECNEWASGINGTLYVFRCADPPWPACKPNGSGNMVRNQCDDDDMVGGCP
ncbi:MAG: hypothetical protein AB1656_17270 [Candidatus Omnitrophota bacterium]